MSSEKVPYAGFGYVNFPVKSDKYQDGRWGICTVRLLVVSSSPSSTEQKEDNTTNTSTDDVFIGTDIHETPESGFNFLQSNKDNIIHTELLGHMNWIGSRPPPEESVWKCTESDLYPEGKSRYLALKEQHPSCTVFICTSMNREASSFKRLMEETTSLQLPKLTNLN